MTLRPGHAYQFTDCHPVNPLTGDVIADLLVWFEVTADGSLYPVPRERGPHRNCSALPDTTRVERMQ
jgi:hypothetical protein